MRLRLFQSVVAVFVITTLFTACQKRDIKVDKAESDVEAKFFNSNRSHNDLEEGIVKFIRRENERKGFVKKVVKQIGFPYWDKMMTVAQKATNKFNDADSSFVVYLPFVRDSQNYVNASMVIHIGQVNTSFNYLSDWDYANKSFSNNVPLSGPRNLRYTGILRLMYCEVRYV